MTKSVSAVYNKEKSHSKNIMTHKNTSAETSQSVGKEALKIAIVVARENHASVESIVRATVQTLEGNGLRENQLRMMWAPSIFQLPLLAKSVAESRNFDGIVVLGAFAQDKTDRYFFEGSEVYRALMDVMMNFGIPMSIGIVSAQKESQMKHDAQIKKEKNRGAIAANDLIAVLTT